MKKSLGLLCAFSALAIVHAHAQLFNFSASGDTPSGLTVLDSGAGGDANYNPLFPSFNTITAEDSTGSTSDGVTSTFSGSGYPVARYADSGGTAITSGDDALMGTYAYNSGGSLTETITGLTLNDNFTLVIYAAGDGASQGSTISLTNNFQSFNSVTTAANNRLIENGVGDAYQEFTGLLLYSTLTITLTSNNENGNSFAILNGLQLEESIPEPSTYASIGFGFALLAWTLRARRIIAG